MLLSVVASAKRHHLDPWAYVCHLLTHLLGQTVEDVAEKLRIYRAAWHKAGHPGNGHVTLMLHTFVAPDEDMARETARQPMKNYLRSAMDLVRKAAWTFPTFVQRAAADGRTPLEVMESAPLSADEMDALLEHAFHRYYGTSALIVSGLTPQQLTDLMKKLQDGDQKDATLSAGNFMINLVQLTPVVDAKKDAALFQPRGSILTAAQTQMAAQAGAGAKDAKDGASGGAISGSHAPVEITLPERLAPALDVNPSRVRES